MIIGIDSYENLKRHVENCIKNDFAVSIEDAIEFGVPFDTLSSLFSQMCLRMGSQFSLSSDSLREDIVRKVESKEESLWSLSRQSNKGSYTFAKHFLEIKFGKDFKIATFLEDPSIVAVAEVRYDLLRMISEDHNNSVEANLIKESTGKDYEDILIELLNNRKMCFETEEESRAKGKPKTPDILFLIPMAITKGKYDPSEYAMSGPSPPTRRSPSKRSTSVQSISFQPDDYLVINWIDSKAMFADKKTFQDHLIQLESYRNRYGRGMVIYWHGVVEDVYTLVSDDMIVIRDSFPDEWMFPTGEPADGRTPFFDSDSNFTNM